MCFPIRLYIITGLEPLVMSVNVMSLNLAGGENSSCWLTGTHKHTLVTLITVNPRLSFSVTRRIILSVRTWWVVSFLCVSSCVSVMVSCCWWFYSTCTLSFISAALSPTFNFKAGFYAHFSDSPVNDSQGRRHEIRNSGFDGNIWKWPETELFNFLSQRQHLPAPCFLI